MQVINGIVETMEKIKNTEQDNPFPIPISISSHFIPSQRQIHILAYYSIVTHTLHSDF